MLAAALWADARRPGFFEGDTVAHCGPTLKGEFVRTLNLVDALIGWAAKRSIFFTRSRTWPLVNDQMNFLTPTKKPIGRGTDRNGRRIHELQHQLTLLAKDKTQQIYLSSFPTALPDVRRGIRVKAG